MDLIKNLLDKSKQERMKDKFYNLVGVEKGEDETVVREKILEYVKNDGDIYSLKLTDEQIADKDFMMSLYEANPKLTSWYGISDVEDIDYVVKFLKLQNRAINPDNENVLKRYTCGIFTSLFKNPEFIEKLSMEFPETNVLDLTWSILSFSNEKEKNNLFNQVTTDVSKETIERQIKKFGADVLERVPNARIDYVEIVDKAVEDLGFKALKDLSIEQVRENKDLIIKAYENSNINDMIYYFKNTISPHRNHSYFCHGEPHSYTSYSPIHAEVREELLADKDISDIFTSNNVKMELSYEKIQHLKAEKIEAEM